MINIDKKTKRLMSQWIDAWYWEEIDMMNVFKNELQRRGYNVTTDDNGCPQFTCTETKMSLDYSQHTRSLLVRLAKDAAFNADTNIGYRILYSAHRYLLARAYNTKYVASGCTAKFFGNM